MSPSTDLDVLLQRFNAVLGKLGQLEQAAGVTAAHTLAYRQQAILGRLGTLEAACGLAIDSGSAAAPVPGGATSPAAIKTGAAASTATAEVGEAPVPRAKPEEHPSIADPAASETQRRLALELLNRGICNHRFVRCPPEYYSQPLEFRRACLDAHSIQHLCKTIVMENTRAHPSVSDWSNPHNSKYYLVLYAARLNAEKLKDYIHKLNAGKFAKRWFNMRLAPEAVSDELSGFSHNAVSPIGIKTRLPIIMSHRIAELQPDFFFLGGGEVDLKVGFSATDFIAAYEPFVVDCTREEADGGEGEDVY
ncbi:hypothetical protein N2152v2_010663 [Parachlorella kessleri]